MYGTPDMNSIACILAGNAGLADLVVSMADSPLDDLVAFLADFGLNDFALEDVLSAALADKSVIMAPVPPEPETVLPPKRTPGCVLAYGYPLPEWMMPKYEPWKLEAAAANADKFGRYIDERRLRLDRDCAKKEDALIHEATAHLQALTASPKTRGRSRADKDMRRATTDAEMALRQAVANRSSGQRI